MSEREELLKQVFEIFIPPFKYNSRIQTVTDSKGNMIFNVRGWGHIQKFKDAEKIQDTYGAYFADLINRDWQAATAQAVPEGYVVVPTTNVHTFYQDDDEPENCCNDESEFDSLGDGLDDGDIMTVNKITLAQIPSGKFYGTWVVDASNRKFELFGSYAEVKQAIKAAQENQQ